MLGPLPSWRGAVKVTALLTALLAAVLLVPVAQGLPDGVPDETWGTNGRVNAIVQVGNLVFLGGTFTEAREDGGAGPGVLARSNIAAFDATTGAPIEGWDPNLNGDVHALAASADGGTIYVGGTFTTVDGLARPRLVALNAATGDVSGTWRPKAPNASVRTLELAGDRIYAGGGFTKVGATTRQRLAALNAVTGALDTSWQPTADALVRTLVVSPDRLRVFAGGDFSTVSGTIRANVVALDAVSGAVDASWHPDPGDNVFGLAVNDATVFAAAGGTANSLYAWDANTASQRWRKRSDGDFQALALASGIVYAGGHFNNFEGELRRKLVAVDAATGALRRDWHPKLPHSAESWAGVWALSTHGTSRLAAGGDFDTVSGFEQAHFAQFTGSLGGVPLDTTPPTTPTGLAASAMGGSEVELAWSASSDDDGVAEYRILRDGVQIATSGARLYSDTAVQPTTAYAYQVVAVDFAGNSSPVSSSATTTTSAPDELRTFAAVEDAYVDATAPDASFGSAQSLTVDANPRRHFLLKFPVSGIGDRRILGAKLRLYTTDASNDGGYIRRLGDNSWSEDTVTWSNAPAGDPALLGALDDIARDAWSELDVTPLVTGDGTVSLRASSSSIDEAGFASTEGDPANAPQLVVTLADRDADVPRTKVFTDGFESGDLSPWSEDDGLGVGRDDRYSGAFAARATSTGHSTYAARNLRVSVPELYYQLRFKVVDQGAGTVSLLKVKTAAGSSIVRLFLATGGKVATRNDVTGLSTTSSTVVAPGGWHTAQLRALVNDAASSVDVWIDGVKVEALSKTESLGATEIGRIELGDDATGKSYDLLFDEAVADTQAIADESAPTAVTGLSAVPSSSSAIDLTWEASSDDVGVTGYEIHRDGSLLTTVGKVTSYTDTTVAKGTSYEYEVTASDAAGNTSPAGEPAGVTTPGVDTAAPSEPALTATAVSFDRVDLNWTASTDDVGVTEYRLYRDGAPLGTVDGRTSVRRDTSVASSTGYGYTVEALDAAGNVSRPSPAARATTPARTVFRDGFESGDLSQWTSGAGLAVEPTSASLGHFAARATTTGQPMYRYKQLGASHYELSYALRFKVVSQSGSFSLLKLRTASGSALARLWLTRTGRLSTRNDVTGASTQSLIGTTVGLWHTVKLRVLVDGAASRLDVWLDGAPVAALSKTESLGITPIGRIQLGDDTAGSTYDVLFDEVAVDAPPANTALPTVSGTSRDGETLTADQGSWSGTEPIAYSYQWQRCDAEGCADVIDATGQSYALGPEDVGSTVSVSVSASNVAGQTSAGSEATAAVAAAPPGNTAIPTITGTVEDGQTLTADRGAWWGTGPIAYSYQWQRCDDSGGGCTDVPGATEETFALTAVDVGSTHRLQVTASNAAGQSTARSAGTERVAAARPANSSPPTISGSPQDGQTLTADPGAWSGTEPLSYAYQWQRCGLGLCNDILGAIERTFELSAADVGFPIRVRVIASNAGGLESEHSGATESVAAPPRLDHFKSYDIGAGEPRFKARWVALEDQFGTSRVSVIAPHTLLNPAGIQGEGISRPDHQLKCYSIYDTTSFGERAVEVANHFGTQRLTVSRPSGLCAPASLGAPGADPGAPPSGRDHFKCYELATASSVSRSVTVEDRFVRDGVVVASARYLCNPAGKDGGGIQRPDDHLVCYELRSLDKLTRRRVSLRDGFGLQTSEVIRPGRLCVPSATRDLGPVPPGDGDDDDG